MNEASSATPDADTGFALAVVLAFLLLAAAFAAPFLTEAKIQALVTRNTGQSIREKVLLRGLIEMAGTRFFELYQDRNTDVASAVRCPAAGLGRTDVIFHFQDHSGLIDLNAAAAEVLAIGFESLAIRRGDAVRLAGDVVRFRSVDDGQRLTGERTPPRGGHKHALFERSAELLDFPAGIDIGLDEIDSVFTVHSGTGTVDDAAARGALSAQLGALKAGERFFVVSDVRRGAALTVEAELVSANGRSVSGRAVLAPSGTSAPPLFLEPVSFHRAARKAAQGPAIPVSQCADFFDPALLEAIAKVTS
jgi:general secretion pathway protein K